MKEFKLSNGYVAKIGHYADNENAIAIQLFKDGEPSYRVSTYIQEFPYQKGMVVVKNYSENEGIMTKGFMFELFDGIIGTTSVGYADHVPVYKLKDKFYK